MSARTITYRWTASGTIYRVSGRTHRTLKIRAERNRLPVIVSCEAMIDDLYLGGYRARESVGGREQPVVDALLLAREVASIALVFGVSESVAFDAAMGVRS